MYHCWVWIRWDWKKIVFYFLSRTVHCKFPFYSKHKSIFIELEKRSLSEICGRKLLWVKRSVGVETVCSFLCKLFPPTEPPLLFETMKYLWKHKGIVENLLQKWTIKLCDSIAQRKRSRGKSFEAFFLQKQIAELRKQFNEPLEGSSYVKSQVNI